VYVKLYLSLRPVAKYGFTPAVGFVISLCPHSGIANPECGRSLINARPAFSSNLFVLSLLLWGTRWHGDWLSASDYNLLFTLFRSGPKLIHLSSG